MLSCPPPQYGQDGSGCVGGGRALGSALADCGSVAVREAEGGRFLPGCGPGLDEVSLGDFVGCAVDGGVPAAGVDTQLAVARPSEGQHGEVFLEVSHQAADHEPPDAEWAEISTISNPMANRVWWRWGAR